MLSSAYIAQLDELIEKYGTTNSVKDCRPRTDPFDTSPSSLETYVAVSPSGGIPALARGAGGLPDQPGQADCAVYRVTLDAAYSPTLASVPGASRTVSNIYTSAVPPGVWVIVTRDKYGTWLIVAASSTSTSSTTTQVDCGGCTQGTWTNSGGNTAWSLVSSDCLAGCLPDNPQFCPDPTKPCSTTQTACVPAALRKPVKTCASTTSSTSTTTVAIWWGGGGLGTLGGGGGGSSGSGGSSGGGSGGTAGKCAAACTDDVQGNTCAGWNGVPSASGFTGYAGPYASLDACYAANAACGKCIYYSTSGIWVLFADRCCGCGKACTPPGFAPSSNCQYVTTNCGTPYTSTTTVTSSSTTSTTTSSTSTTSTTTQAYYCFTYGTGVKGCDGLNTGNAATPHTGPYATLTACVAACGTTTTGTTGTTGTTTTTTSTTTTTTSSTSTTSTTTEGQRWICNPTTGVCYDNRVSVGGTGTGNTSQSACNATCVATTTTTTTGTSTSSTSGTTFTSLGGGAG